MNPLALLMHWRLIVAGLAAIGAGVLWSTLLVTRADLRDAKAELGEIRAEGQAQAERSKRITAGLQSQLTAARGQLEKDLPAAKSRADDLDGKLRASAARLAACALSGNPEAAARAGLAGGGPGSLSDLLASADRARRGYLEAAARDSARLDACRAAWPEVKETPAR